MFVCESAPLAKMGSLVCIFPSMGTLIDALLHRNFGAAIRANARHTAEQLTKRSALLSDVVASAQLNIHSAYFDIGTGTVSMI